MDLDEVGNYEPETQIADFTKSVDLDEVAQQNLQKA